MIGTTISHYQILEKLGEGGMGRVYKARDSHLDRFVVLKILPAEKVADPDRRRRLVQEAKAATALNHPHIVTFYDIDEADGVHFIAMESLEGQTLEHGTGVGADPSANPPVGAPSSIPLKVGVKAGCYSSFEEEKGLYEPLATN